MQNFFIFKPISAGHSSMEHVIPPLSFVVSEGTYSTLYRQEFDTLFFVTLISIRGRINEPTILLVKQTYGEKTTCQCMISRISVQTVSVQYVKNEFHEHEQHPKIYSCFRVKHVIWVIIPIIGPYGSESNNVPFFRIIVLARIFDPLSYAMRICYPIIYAQCLLFNENYTKLILDT